jgi:DNA-binding transcriptional MerR regulator
LGPGEAAARLGVTVKALRVYERAGLVRPDRTASDRRTYGPAQIARLHTILILRELGFSLRDMKETLDGRDLRLSALLAAQQDALERKLGKIADAIEYVRAARLRIAQGTALSMDDLIQLSRETIMDDAAMTPEAKAGLQAHLEANVPREDLDAFRATWKPELAAADKDALKAEAAILLAEMKKLAEIGDPDSPAAKAAVQRWKAVMAGFSPPKIEVREGLVRGCHDAVNDEAIASQLPFDRKVLTFMRDVAAKLQTGGRSDL